VVKTMRQTQKDNVLLVGLPIFPERNTIADIEYKNINYNSFIYLRKKGTL